MTFENGPKIEIFGAKETRTIVDFFDLSLDEVLELHDISIDICFYGKKMSPNNKKWNASFVKDIFLEGANVVFQYDEMLIIKMEGSEEDFVISCVTLNRIWEVWCSSSC